MAMVGADADRLTAAAAQMRASADELDLHSKSINQTLGGVSWIGQVATAFVSMWNSGQRAQLHSTANFIRDAATKLDGHAQQQRDTSAASGGALGGAGVATIAPLPTPLQLASADDIRNAIADAKRPMDAARKVLPGAVGRLEAWAKELETGEHTAAEVQAFKKYKEMIILANSLRATVGMAATSGIDARNAAIQGGTESALSIGLSHASGAVGQSGTGLVTGGAAARQGFNIADVELISTATENLTSAGAEALSLKIMDQVGVGIETGDPLAIRGAYQASADAYLVQVEDQFRASTNEKPMDAGFIRSNSVSEFYGKYEVAMAYGNVSQAFDLGPLSPLLSAGMDTLVPKSGTITFAVLGGLEAGYDMKASASFLNLATAGSMDQLQRSVLYMKL